MEKINDILSEFKVSPSEGVWEKLSGRLDAVMPSTSSGESMQSSGKAVSHVGWSLGVKIAIAVAGFMSVVAIIAIVAVSMKDYQNQSVSKEEITVQENACDAVDSLYREDTAAIKNNVSNILVSPSDSIPYNESESKEATKVAQDPISPSLSFQADVVTNSTHPYATTPTPVSPNKKVPLSKPVSSTTSQSHVATAVQQDPVVQNLPEESIDWSVPVKLEIPNVFTPNGDGYNDRFEIQGLESCSKRQLMVYNKYGKLVYKSNSYENNWDGADCPDGSYAYRFLYNSGGVDQIITGSLYIIRK